MSNFQYPSGLPVCVIELDPGPTTSREGSRENPIEVDKSPLSLETLFQEHESQGLTSPQSIHCLLIVQLLIVSGSLLLVSTKEARFVQKSFKSS